MKKKIVGTLAVGMALCFAGCGAAKEEQAQDIPAMSATQEQSQTVEATATPEPFQYDLVISEDRKFLENIDLLGDMAVTIEGKTIEMPCKLDELTDAGFRLVDYFGSETTVEDYIKNSADLDGYVEPQGELVSFLELDYTSFIFDNQYAMGSGLFNDLSVGNSMAKVSFGEDYKEVLGDYGDPTTVWIQDGTGLAELTYYTEKDENGNSYSLGVKLMNGKVESISYQCF